METLAEETWDLVIAGTGLAQALLALSLSRSKLRILHVDENLLYGGTDAGLSLDEAAAWVRKHESATGILHSAIAVQPTDTTSKLAVSRAYTLSLNPQIIYAQSTLLPALVSSNVNTQLEFMAVGSWWVNRGNRLQKVPSSREDVFADESLTRKDKIGVMKFLRHVLCDETFEPDGFESPLEGSLGSTLTTRFKISPNLQLPISSLALIPQSVNDAAVEPTVSRIQRHMRSMGYFGPGFGAVVAKYAGNAEIAQVCCRACAVGGATYLLGQGVARVDETGERLKVTLSNGVEVQANRLIGSVHDLPAQAMNDANQAESGCITICRSVTIVSSPLRKLFPPTSDNGPVPAAAIVMVVDDENTDQALHKPPIYLQVHSGDTGECPPDQCVVYGSTLHPTNTKLHTTQERLASAVNKLLDLPADDSSPAAEHTRPEMLWSMSYFSQGQVAQGSSSTAMLRDESNRILTFPSRVEDIVFDDGVLQSVKEAWKTVLADNAIDDEFLRFEARSGMGADDE